LKLFSVQHKKKKVVVCLIFQKQRQSAKNGLLVVSNPSPMEYSFNWLFFSLFMPFIPILELFWLILEISTCADEFSGCIIPAWLFYSKGPYTIIRSLLLGRQNDNKAAKHNIKRAKEYLQSVGFEPTHTIV
jgi:hypothetical protein